MQNRNFYGIMDVEGTYKAYPLSYIKGDILMKHMRILTVILLACSLLLTLAACGSDEGDYDYSYSSYDGKSANMYGYESDFGFAAESEAYDYADDAVKADMPTNGGRKIIYSASFSMQTNAYDDATAKLESLVTKYGAYFESADSYGTADSADRYASYTVRVPVENYNAFRNEAAGIAVVIASGQNNEDVTETYFDKEARLESAKLRESRLLELLVNAANLDDILALERELADVRYEIESYEGTLRKFDSLVNYATVTIYLEEVTSPVVIQPVPVTFGERTSQALSGGFEDFGKALQDAVVGLCYALPTLLLWIVIGVIIYFIVRAIVRKSKKHYAMQTPPVIPSAPQNPQPPTQTPQQ